MSEYSKNPCFCFEETIRIAFRAYNNKIDIKEEDRLVYIINYLMDMYYNQEIDNMLAEQIIPKIDYQD